MWRLLALLLVPVLCGWGSSSTTIVGNHTRTQYYLDQDGGNDGWTGTSRGDPWATIAQINSASPDPGDEIYLERGDSWSEQLLLADSGTSGNPITFGAYGTGADPIISFEAAISGTSIDYIIIQDMDIQGWSYEAIENNFGDGWVIRGVTVAGGRTATGYTPEVDPEIRAINIVGTNVTPIDGFTLEDSEIGTISDAEITDNRVSALHLFYVQDAQVNGNTFNTLYVLALLAQNDFGLGPVVAPSVTVENNEFDTCNRNITLRGQDGAVVQRNHIHDGKGSGVGVWFSQDVTVAYNLIHDLAATTAGTIFNGIDVNGSSEDGFIYNNTIYAVESECLTIEDSVTPEALNPCNGWTIKNNIYDASANTQVNRVGGERYPLGIHSGVLDGEWTDTHNLLYDYQTPPSQTYVVTRTTPVPAVDPKTFAQWQTAGFGANSKNANPLFTNAGAGIFTLQSGSPAIDAGDFVGLTTDILGNPIVGAPDMGAYEVQ